MATITINKEENHEMWTKLFENAENFDKWYHVFLSEFVKEETKKINNLAGVLTSSSVVLNSYAEDDFYKWLDSKGIK